MSHFHSQRMCPRVFSILSLLVLLSLFLPASNLRAAAVLQVNSVEDRVDLNLGDALCDTGYWVEDQPECTLRAAIQEANVQSGMSEIHLPAGIYSLTLGYEYEYDKYKDEDAALTGDLDITDDLQIIGTGAEVTIIDGNRIDRLFDIFGSSQVLFADLTIQNGRAEGGGGGILNRGMLTLQGAVVRRNWSEGNGHGIHNLGSLVVRNSQILSNGPESWASNYMGGGIYNHGDTVTIYDSALDNNAAAVGAAIYNDGGIITLTRCNIQGNFARFYWSVLGAEVISECTIADNGGGIGGTSLITGSTISGNYVYRSRGLITSGSLTIVNSSISGNDAEMYDGMIEAEVLEIVNSTIWGNGNGDITPSDASAILHASGRGKVSGSILAGNGRPNCAGAIVSGGYNLDSDGSCNFSESGDLVGVDANLGPLADNGGTTLTHALLPGSPAVDAIDPSACLVKNDQRGLARPQGSACDMGAFELEQSINHAPDCSLARAVPALLWPVNNQFVPIQIADVADADGDVLTIRTTHIYQDEAVGKPPHAPDGQGIGTATADVRAERDGKGDGRVYHIHFTAADGRDGLCAGVVRVAVPHDQGKNIAVDSGALYDSTAVTTARGDMDSETPGDLPHLYLPVISAE